jgi:serine protease
VRFTDDLSGVTTRGGVTFDSPSRTTYAVGYPALIAGDKLDGTYTFQVQVPQYAETGTWHLRDINISDNAGHSASYLETGLAALGFPTTFVNGH